MFLSDYPYFPDYSDVIFRLKPRCLALPTQKIGFLAYPHCAGYCHYIYFFYYCQGFSVRTDKNGLQIWIQQVKIHNIK